MDEEYVAAAVVVDERGHAENERLYFKQLRDRSNPFSRSERKFRKMFRLSREVGRNFVDILCSGVNNPLHFGTIPAHLKVLSALNFFAHGSYQTAVGEINILGQSQPTVSRCLRDVCPLILEKLTPLWIKFPMTRQEKLKTMQGFQDMYGIPHTLGAVDGTHIAIQKPPINHPTAPGSLFYNRKGYYSINCQMICDAEGRITSVNPNFPGSTHDAAIWQSSNIHLYLKEQYLDHHPMEWLLGDKGYPLLPWLMTPHAEAHPGTPEERYNKVHSQARVRIEMTFGHLKNVLRCMNRHRTLHYSPEKAAQIIISCCTIHNILIWSANQDVNEDSGSESEDDQSDSESSADEEIDNEYDEPDEPEPVVEAANESFLDAARQRRAAFITNNFL